MHAIRTFLLPRDAILQLRASKFVKSPMPAWTARTCSRSGLRTRRSDARFHSVPLPASLLRGETFYSHNLGLPELRSTVASYLSALHANPAAAITSEHVAITSAGVNALSLAAQCIVNPGDRVVCVTPLWPNLVEIPKILSANVECVSLQFGESGWQLDMDRLLAALTPDTRLLMVNSPNNPTGWTLTRAEQQAILDRCRQHGIWLLADDAYERLVFDEAGVAPSFFDIAHADDRLVSANTFSKSWLMTGWRLGWWHRSPLSSSSAKSSSTTPRARRCSSSAQGIAAITGGDPVIARTQRRFRERATTSAPRSTPCRGACATTAGRHVRLLQGGRDDRFARLLQTSGCRTGAGRGARGALWRRGEGFVRWCFASDPKRLDDGIARFKQGLQSLR